MLRGSQSTGSMFLWVSMLRKKKKKGEKLLRIKQGYFPLAMQLNSQGFRIQALISK